jgi:hypothetical protein
MAETFLILLAAGVMLAVAVPRPRDVTLHWLRLGGIIALVMAGLSVFLWLRRESPRTQRETLLYLAVTIAILFQLAMTQIGWARVQRLFAAVASASGVTLGTRLCGSTSMLAVSFSCAGIAAMTGLALMDMLLGHAYLTASNMTMPPFRRLNDALGIMTILRMMIAVGGVLWLNSRRPVEMFWGVYGLYAITRWLVGLAVPMVFVYMARDCIKRRATQSATGILYVAGVLIFIGEILALHLVRETGLPF